MNSGRERMRRWLTLVAAPISLLCTDGSVRRRRRDSQLFARGGRVRDGSRSLGR